MVPRPIRILCVGNDTDLLRTRCAVLSQTGYETKSATVPEAQTLLRTTEYDLVIVSALLTDQAKRIALSAVGSRPVLLLNGLTLVPELLALVKERLVP